jgi:DNA-binding MarR family transcriptional regulator
MGIVVRISRWDGRRATHVQLTKIGRAEAERLAKEQEESVAALLSTLTLQLPLEPVDDAQQGA